MPSSQPEVLNDLLGLLGVKCQVVVGVELHPCRPSRCHL